MRSNYLFLRGKTCGFLLATSLFLFNGCTIGYDKDEVFTTDVKNTTLKSPNLEDITITFDATGENATVEWAVVQGAEGYECLLYNVDVPENPVPITETKVVDGCRLGIKNIPEDTNFKFSIKAIGNKMFNNKDAEAATDVLFTTLIETYASIPEGTDLTQWFADNPIPANDAEPNEDGTLKELAYELKAGGQYTVSAPIDFGARRVTIRGNKKNHAVVTFDALGRLYTQNGFKLKFIDFNCNAMEKGSTDAALLVLSKTPNEDLKVASGDYLIKDPIVIQSCNIYDINRHLFYDSSKKYCLENMTIKDCYIKTNQSNILLYFKTGGFINFTLKESTLYSTIQNGNYFAQVNGTRPSKVTGYSGGSFNIYNSTIYNIAYSKDFVNWNQYKNQSVVTINLSKSVFVDSGKGDFTNKMMGDNNTKNFEYNTYWYDGQLSDDKFDTNTLKTDPGFSDPANGKFTISGADQLDKRTGDPRWLPFEVEK